MDFVQGLPLELAHHILGFTGVREKCMCAKVSSSQSMSRPMLFLLKPMK
jgi:hypothetical protein